MTNKYINNLVANKPIKINFCNNYMIKKYRYNPYKAINKEKYISNLPLKKEDFVHINKNPYCIKKIKSIFKKNNKNNYIDINNLISNQNKAINHSNSETLDNSYSNSSELYNLNIYK